MTNDILLFYSRLTIGPMRLAQSPRYRLVVALVAIATIYWVLMFAGTHIPWSATGRHDPNSLDKWLHAAAFGLLAILVGAAGTTWFGASWKLYAGILFVLALYAAFDEATQSLVAGREADLFDWLSDL